MNMTNKKNEYRKMNLADELLKKMDEKQNPCVVGLDPVIERIPKHLIPKYIHQKDSFEYVARAFTDFNCAIIDAVADLVPAVKPQIAFYAKYGAVGLQAFKDTVDYAHSKGLIVIEDGKRGDIGSTSQAYADGHLGVVRTQSSQMYSLNVDILTVNPYLGSDGLLPFVNVCSEHNKGIFILTKTSNPSAGEFQDRLMDIDSGEEEELRKLGVQVAGKTQLYNLVALHVNRYAQKQIGERGYSSIGAVVGATYPREAIMLRKIMPNSIFLVPGYGAQGATAKDLTNCFNDDGYGAVVNSSREIIFAYEKEKNNEPEKFEKASRNFAEHARKATKLMIEDICGALKDCGKYPVNWKEHPAQP